MKPSDDPRIKEKFRVANVHQWLKKNYGKSNRCELCGDGSRAARYEWALIDGKSHEKARDNYMMLCTLCHRKYDWHTGRHERQKEILRNAGMMYGGNNGKIMRKFTEREAQTIRERCKNGESQCAIARSLGVNQATISLLVRYKTYAQLQQQ